MHGGFGGAVPCPLAPVHGRFGGAVPCPLVPRTRGVWGGCSLSQLGNLFCVTTYYNRVRSPIPKTQNNFWLQYNVIVTFI
ncbi:hypothetical protein PL10110_200190 [Planktothrix agardhii]|nr:hypothetical protein PL10110_200190 [Planktothrix agardhii]